jgi:hypothetical protein
MKVMSFRTTEAQIDVLHDITHGTATSASEIIRRAIDTELERLFHASEEGLYKLPKYKQEHIMQYFDWSDIQEAINE